jgi:hypothetical protein
MPDNNITHGVIAGIVKSSFYIQETTQGYLLLAKGLLNTYSELFPPIYQPSKHAG